MFEWLSDNRATFALVTIIGLVAAFVWSVSYTHLTLPTSCCV